MVAPGSPELMPLWLQRNPSQWQSVPAIRLRQRRAIYNTCAWVCARVWEYVGFFFRPGMCVHSERLLVTHDNACVWAGESVIVCKRTANLYPIVHVSTRLNPPPAIPNRDRVRRNLLSRELLTASARVTRVMWYVIADEKWLCVAWQTAAGLLRFSCVPTLTLCHHKQLRKKTCVQTLNQHQLITEFTPASTPFQSVMCPHRL